MSIEEKLIHDFLALPDDKRKKVINYVESLKNSTKQIENVMDEIISENHKALKELSK